MKALLLWLSDPANITLLLGAIGGAVMFMGNVLLALGRAKDGARLLRASAAIGELQADRAKGTATIVALVTGGEQIKASLDLDAALRPLDGAGPPPKTDSQKVSRLMQAAAEAAGVEHILAPIVTAVQAETPSSLVIRKATDRYDAGHVAARVAVAERIADPAAPPATPQTPGASP